MYHEALFAIYNFLQMVDKMHMSISGKNLFGIAKVEKIKKHLATLATSIILHWL